jgi:hypothetical protein
VTDPEYGSEAAWITFSDAARVDAQVTVADALIRQESKLLELIKNAP